MKPRRRNLSAAPGPVPPPPPPRTIDDVNREYTQEACEIGSKKFKVQLLEWQINNHIMKMKLLDDEAGILLELQKQTQGV